MIKFYKKQRFRYKRISTELFWIIIGQIASFLGSIFLVRVLTEKLDPSEYGELALALTISVLVYQIVNGGINNSIGRFYSISIEKKDFEGFLGASFQMLFWATLFVIGLTVLLIFSLKLLELEKWIWLSIVVLIFSVLSSYNNALNALQNAARQRIVVALHGGMNSWLKIGLAIIVMYYLGSNSISVVIGYSISALFVVLSQIIFLKRLIVKQTSLIKDKISKSKENWLKEMWKFSWPFSTWGLFTWAQLASDRWAIEWFSSTAEVGQFVVLYQIGYASISMLTKMSMTLIGPILYERSGDAKDSKRNSYVNNISWRITYASLVVSILAFIFTYYLHGWLFRILVAESFREISYFLPWVVLAGGLFATAQMLSLKVLSELRSNSLISIKIITALIAVFTNIIGAWLFGLIGVVGSLVFFSLTYLVWMMILAKNVSFNDFINNQKKD